MRAALYARYSTDMQRAASIADQLHACRRLAAQLGARVVAEFSDAAISGQTMARPGFQDLMAAAERGELDLVIAEHTDRLSRDGGHSYDIYYELTARDVRIVTVNQGEIGLMHVGTAGLMSAMFIDELRKKVRRGLEGVVREGRYTGAPAYGYRVARAYDAAGERVRGLREIEPDEAAVVRRIFEAVAAGMTSGEVAAMLNAEAVPTRGGGRWHKAAILGAPADGTGILRNELYRGRLVWGRRTQRKDRRTGKVRSIPNPAERQVRDAPELRIVSDELWDRAHAQLARRTLTSTRPRAQRRGPTLLGSLVRCGCCGSRMVFTGLGDTLRCAQRVQHQVECGNVRTPHYADVEARVLTAIEANLLHPDVVSDAARAFAEAEREAQATLGRRRAELERALADAQRRAARLIQQVEEGAPWAAVAARHGELTARAAELEAQLAAEPPAPVSTLLPSAAGLYRKAAQDVRKALALGADTAGPNGKPGAKPTARAAAAPDPVDQAAREGIRRLVNEITITPAEGRGRYEVQITANLAALLPPTAETMRAATVHSQSLHSHSGSVTIRLSA